MQPINTSNHPDSRTRAELVNLACEVLATWYPAVPQSLIRCQVETLQTDHLSDFADAVTDSATAEGVSEEEQCESTAAAVAAAADDDDNDDDDDEANTNGDDSTVNTKVIADLSLLDPEAEKELLRDVELDTSQVLSSTGSSENDEGFVVLPPPINDFPVLILQDDAERCERSHDEIRQVLHFLKIEQFVRSTRAPRAPNPLGGDVTAHKA